MFLVLLISTLLPLEGITHASPAITVKSNYYFVYNSLKVDAKDLAAIKKYAAKFKNTNNVLFDAKNYKEASKLLDGLKAQQQKIGGKVAGVQIFGIKDDVPAFSYVHKVQVIPATERWDGIEYNKEEKFVTDFFYSTFKNDSKYLHADVLVFDVFEKNVPLTLIPEWPVSRLLLTKGEIAGYVDRYDAYRKQIKDKSVPNVVLAVPTNFQDGLAQNDAALFTKRLKEEFGLFKNSDLRTYYKDLKQTLVQENKNGVMNLMVNSLGDGEGAKQNKELFMSRATVKSGLASNYYTAFFWGMSPARGLGSDNIIHDGLTKGKMINPISHTVTASNGGGLNNYIWAMVEENEQGQEFDYVPVTYEMLQEINPYYFIYHYYAGLDEGKTRLQSFHEAKVEYAKQTMEHRDTMGFMQGFENVISLHYLGLADYE